VGLYDVAPGKRHFYVLGCDICFGSGGYLFGIPTFVKESNI
jgi:hypothetical protein